MSKGWSGLRADFERERQVAKAIWRSCPRLQVPRFWARLNVLHRRVEARDGPPLAGRRRVRAFGTLLAQSGGERAGFDGASSCLGQSFAKRLLCKIFQAG